MPFPPPPFPSRTLLVIEFPHSYAHARKCVLVVTDVLLCLELEGQNTVPTSHVMLWRSACDCIVANDGCTGPL